MSSMFNNASNLVISGGSFTINNHRIGAIEPGFKLLHEKIAHGAMHDSLERYDPPKCHPGTREAVIAKIRNWVGDPAKESYFMWLYGPAGEGKSAIAQTIAELCFNEGRAAGSYFFSRSAVDRNVETFLVSTLVYQLMYSIPDMRKLVLIAMEKDPELLSKSLKSQAEALIIRPLNELARNPKTWTTLQAGPRLIIIDGLNECLDAQSQVYILEVLSSIVKELAVPLFFLVASRHEHHIRDAFSKAPLFTLTIHLNLDDSFLPDADIKHFLDDKFADIRHNHPFNSLLPTNWPTNENVAKLVNKSSGQFIYVSTVVKYIESPWHWPPDRLDIVFGLQNPGNSKPFAELDALYMDIFSTVDRTQELTDVLTFLLLYPLPADAQKADTINQYLFYRPGKVEFILRDLHSIIAVSPGDSESELRFFHSSVSDFLLDPSRSAEFFIKQDEGYTKILLLTLKHMKAPNNDLDGIVHETFTRCYSKAYPSLELLDALYDFDVFEYLNSLQKGDLQEEVPKLSAWLKGKRHPDREKDLLDHHLSSVEKFLRTIPDPFDNPDFFFFFFFLNPFIVCWG